MGSVPAPECSKAGSASSAASGSATQVWMPKSRSPLRRRAVAERSECVIPRPAIIQLTAPGSISIAVPSEARWKSPPS